MNVFKFEAIYFLRLSLIFGILKAVQINFDEKIIGVYFISGHISPLCSVFGPKLHNCNHAIKGAQQAGLDPNYIKKLSKQPTYKPNDAVLKARKERSERVEEFDEITVEQLSKNENWVSCLGYVFEHEKVSFRSVGPNSRILIVRGKDITIRTLLHFHGMTLDDNDDKGKFLTMSMEFDKKNF